MSTGADCGFREVEPGRWRYRLQRWPYGENDEYDEYGPFPSFAAARRHLNENHANPGGYSIGTHPTGHVHEFTGRGGYRKEAFVLEVRVESLPADATREQVIALVQSLDPAHPALQVRSTEVFDPQMVVCEACGKER